MQPVSTDSTRLYELLAWLEVNKKRVAIGMAAALVLFVVLYVYRYFREQTELVASKELLALRPPAQEGEAPASASPTDLLKVATQYRSTSAGERALLLAAGNLFAEGKYTEAQTQFDRFRKDYARSPLAPIAALGTAASLDALEQIDAALAAYQSVVNQYPDDAVAARARLAMATLHEAKNQPEQAYRMYDELSKQAGGGTIVSEAASRREKLQRRFPQLAATNAPQPFATTAVNPPPAAAATNPAPAAPVAAPPPTNTPAAPAPAR